MAAKLPKGQKVTKHGGMGPDGAKCKSMSPNEAPCTDSKCGKKTWGDGAGY